MNKIYIIKEMTEMDYWDGDYNIPVTTIIQEAELINTIIPSDGKAPFYEVVPLYIIDEYNKIREQKPLLRNNRGISTPINSIYVNKIFSNEKLALEDSHSRNIDIIINRSNGIGDNSSSIRVIQSEIDHMLERIKKFHELEKRINPGIDEETINYYTYLLERKIESLKFDAEKGEKKGRRLVYENKNNNKWYYI